MHPILNRIVKQLFLLLIALMFSSARPALAHQSNAFYAKDFTFVPLNSGAVPFHLYEWLDKGKYVIIDASASWCGPCWGLHYSRLLDHIYLQYGPGSETDDVRVVMVEIDGGTTDDDLQRESPNSLGNWLEGTDFPLCNPSWDELAPFRNAYPCAFVPTLFLVCPNRSVIEIVENNYMNPDYSYKSAAEVYSFIKSVQCPELSSVEMALSYFNFITPLFTSDGLIGLDWQAQNRGSTDIDSLTVRLLADGQPVSEYTWRTALEPYSQTDKISMETNQIPAGTSYLEFELTAHSASKDTIAISRRYKIAVYNDANKYYGHYFENFDSIDSLPVLFGPATDLANKMYEIAGTMNSHGNSNVVGTDGNPTNALLIPFYRLDPKELPYTGAMSVGHFSTIDVDSVTFEFDLAYAMPSETVNQTDALEVVAMYGSSRTWRTAWGETSPGLMSTPAVDGEFVPKSAEQWKHVKLSIDVLGYEDVILGFRASSAFGNNCYLDNLKLTLHNRLGAEEVPLGTISIVPNPVGDYFSVSGCEGRATLFDVTGRAVWSGDVASGRRIGATSLASGVYILKIGGKALKAIKE